MVAARAVKAEEVHSENSETGSYMPKEIFLFDTGKTDRYSYLTKEPYVDYYVSVLRNFVPTLTGINFILAVRDKYGSIGFYPRVDQPCMGEFRRYWNKNENHKQATPHGDIAKSKKNRPQDLYCPFPSGTPEMFGIRFTSWNPVTSADKKYLPIIEFLVSDKSPWRKGLGGRKAVELVWDDKGVLQGLISKTSDIDPSVFVQFAWTMKYSLNLPTIQSYLDKGATMKEAFLLTMPHSSGCGYGPQKCDLRRFLTSDPRELSFGSLRNGGDYARSWAEQPFGAEAIWHSDSAPVFWTSIGGKTPGVVKRLKKRIADEGLTKESEDC